MRLILIMTFHVDVPVGQSLEIKEDITMKLEKYGDVKLVSIWEKRPEQMKIQGMRESG